MLSFNCFESQDIQFVIEIHSKVVSHRWWVVVDCIIARRRWLDGRAGLLPKWYKPKNLEGVEREMDFHRGRVGFGIEHWALGKGELLRSWNRAEIEAYRAECEKERVGNNLKLILSHWMTLDGPDFFMSRYEHKNMSRESGSWWGWPQPNATKNNDYWRILLHFLSLISYLLSLNA